MPTIRVEHLGALRNRATRYDNQSSLASHAPAASRGNGQHLSPLDHFAAAQALVDEVKARLPVWKKQIHADGTHSWSGLENAR